jgi:hypothetical protein
MYVSGLTMSNLEKFFESSFFKATSHFAAMQFSKIFSPSSHSFFDGTLMRQLNTELNLEAP